MTNVSVVRVPRRNRKSGDVYLPFIEDEHTVLEDDSSRFGRPRSTTSVRSPKMKMAADEKELLESVEFGEFRSAGGGSG